MSLLELATAAALVAWAVVGHRRLALGLALAGVGTLATIALAVGDRWRWQLVPLAVAAGVAVVVQLLRATGRGGEDLGRRTAAVAVTGGVALALLSGLALPVPRLSIADGTGPVGTTAFDLVDPERRSPSTTVPPDRPRSFTVQAWWPAAEPTGERLRLTDDGPGLAAAAGDFLGLPPLVLGHLAVVETAAWVDAPPATAGRLPVVVSLHGWGGFRFAQAPLLEQLAADGFLVLATEHTHGALATQPVGGGVVPIDEQLLPDGVDEATYDAAATTLEDTFRGDAATLLGALRAGDDAVPAPVRALADLDRLVVLGHSTGGGAAVWLCTTDPGCDGVLTYDPWVEPIPPDVRATPPDVPWLSVLSDPWTDDENADLLAGMVADAAAAEVVAVEGTEHRDVTVQPLLSPLAPLLGLAGDLDKQRTDEVTTALTRAFLADVLDAGPGDPAVLDTPPTEVDPRPLG